MQETASLPEQATVLRTRAARVEILVPVRNEQDGLARSVRRLRAYLDDRFPFTAGVCIVDNGSTDATWAVALELVEELEGVRAVRLDEPGRGRALKTVWSCTDADVLAYMDVDLSTDLDAFLPLVAPLLSGHSDVAIGTRLGRTSRVVRGPQREVLSRGYNALLRTVMGSRFSDAQCGFKAIRADVAAELLPLVRDTGWFFDTELLVLAERAGLRIHEVPVDWVDDPDSRVAIVPTVLADLRGMLRVSRGFATGRLDVSAVRARFGRGPLEPVRVVPAERLFRFCCVGAASTVAYAVLYLLLRTVWDAQAANLIALLVTAVGNTALNRQLTFGITGSHHRGRHHAKGLVAFGIGWALTAGALALAHALVADPTAALEITLLTTANLLATVLRFVLLSSWVFRPAASPRPDRLDPCDQGDVVADRSAA